MVSVTMINGETDVVLQTTNGTFLRFPLEEISVLKKASRGVRGIRLAKNEELKQYISSVKIRSSTIKAKKFI